MYRTIKDFIEDWKEEEMLSIKIFLKINDKIKAKKASANTRSLDRLAWHITQTITEMPYKAGIMDKDHLDGLAIPDSMEIIIKTYQKYSEELIDLLAKKWTNTGLTEKIEIYGQQWERRKILHILVKHQTHHRGQMTTIMRLLDQDVPGIYGPSHEEWSQYGMEAQE
jgi:uncharacterized damage-inducible protein DinB